jgi:hypothetical protein
MSQCIWLELLFQETLRRIFFAVTVLGLLQIWMALYLVCGKLNANGTNVAVHLVGVVVSGNITKKNLHGHLLERKNLLKFSSNIK